MADEQEQGKDQKPERGPVTHGTIAVIGIQKVIDFVESPEGMRWQKYHPEQAAEMWVMLAQAAAMKQLADAMAPLGAMAQHGPRGQVLTVPPGLKIVQ